MNHPKNKIRKIIKVTCNDLFVYHTDTSTFPLRQVKMKFRVHHLMMPCTMIHINSGLGGAFLLEYVESKNGEILFLVANPGYTDLAYKVRLR